MKRSTTPVGFAVLLAVLVACVAAPLAAPSAAAGAPRSTPDQQAWVAMARFSSLPTGSMSLNGGSTYTGNTTVTIDSAVTDATEMRFRNAGGVWSDWQAYGAAKPWILPTGDGTFATKVDYTIGTEPCLIAVGDFNADGRRDLATANYGSDTLSVLLGDGDGAFAAAVDYTTGSHPHGIAVGDLDADGKQDLIVTNQFANTLSVLLGNGDGTFQAKIDTATGSAPVSVAVGDFDADGKQDLAVVNANSYSVGVLLGDGDGTFQAKPDLPTATYAPYSVAVGDFNSDGKQDLAVAHCNNYYEAHVWLGNGDGTFGTRADYPTGNNPYSIAIGDFNADGRQDLVTANVGAVAGGDSVSVLLGVGDGTFAAAVDYATGDSPYSVAIGDFNSDGKQDLVTANGGSDTLSVLLGNGDGTFAAKVDYTAGTFSYSVAVGDFDSDGAQDLATTNYLASSVSVLLGKGKSDGTKTVEGQYRDAVGNVLALSDTIILDTTDPETSDDAPSGWHNHAITVTLTASDTGGSGVASTEYKLDADPDWTLYTIPIAVTADGDHTLTYRSHDNAGNIEDAKTVHVKIDLDPTGSFSIDGGATYTDTAAVTLDSSVSDYTALQMRFRNAGLGFGWSAWEPYAVSKPWLVATGDGTFSPKTDFATGPNPFSLAAGDFNADGKQDLVTGNVGTLCTGTTLSVLLGTGDGAFAAPVDYSTGENPRSVAVGDFNADGKQDLVAVGSTYDTVSVLLGNGNGTFQAQVQYSTGDNPITVAVGDFNADGKQDLVTANWQPSGSVSILLGNGNGTFQAQVQYAAGGGGWGCNEVAVGDLNADGKQDLVTDNSAGDTVSVLLGNGNGTFQAQVRYSTGHYPNSVAIGDFNADGKQDLAVTNVESNPGTVAVLLGNGNGTFGPKTDVATGTGPCTVAVGDFNADGRQDLVTANGAVVAPDPAASTVSVLLGNGNGTFGVKADYATGTGPFRVVVGDFNADGKQDLATGINGVPASDGSTVSVLLGNGVGGGGTKTVEAEYKDAVGNVLALSDDIVLDTVDPETSDDAPSGWHDHAITVTLTATDIGGSGVASTEYRLDADPDWTTYTDPIEITAEGDHTLTYRSHDNAGNIEDAKTVHVKIDRAPTGSFAIDGGATYTNTTTATLDSSVTDYSALLMRFRNAGGVWSDWQAYGAAKPWILPTGDGTFGAKTDCTIGARPLWVTVGDFNSDGKQDLVTANHLGDTVSVLLGNGDGSFAANTDYATGSGPDSVAVGDFNTDGKQDLVTSNYGGTVSVLLGNGDGSFAAHTDYATGLHSMSVAVGDFNADGRQDLAVANYEVSTLSVLLGNGDGTFAAATDYDTGTGPLSVAVGDFNGDGKQDLVMTIYYTDTVSVWLGNGDGTFAATTDYGTGPDPFSVTVGDFDSDGKQDLVTANYGGADTVSVLLGNGSGGFAAKVDYATGSGPSCVAVGDFNSDGRQDLVATNSWNGAGGNAVSVLLGTGDGSFAAKTDYASGAAPWAVVVGDFDSDGRQDLATANEADATVSVLLGKGTGDGTKTVEGQYRDAAGNVVALSDDIVLDTVDPETTNDALAGWHDHAVTVTLTATDAGGSGVDYTEYKLDSAPTWSTYSAPVEITADGDHTLTYRSRDNAGNTEDEATVHVRVDTTEPVTTDDAPSGWHDHAVTVTLTATDTGGSGVASTEYKLDGDLDWTTYTGPIEITSEGDHILTYRSHDNVGNTEENKTAHVKIDHFPTGSFSIDGGATYTNTTATTLDSSVSDYSALRMRFRNAGGVWSDWQPYGAAKPWILSTGDGTFAAKTDYPTGAYPTFVAVGDFNSDGKQDLVTANYLGDTVSVLLGNGSGGFGAPTSRSMGTSPRSVALGDFNADGKQDLVTANHDANTVSVLLGNGDGTFQAKIDTATGLAPVSVAVGDFDADGKQDLAVVNGNSYSVGVLLGHGDGTFGARTDLPTKFGAPHSVAVGDFNADGKQDLAVAHCNNYYEVNVWLGNGDGTFGARADYPTGNNPISIAIGDFDADGKQDLVTADYSVDTVSVLLGSGDGTFAAKVDYATGDYPMSIAIGDFNSDGRQDLVTADLIGNSASVLLGNGDGAFGAKADFPTGAAPRSVAVGDFNADGAQDLATATSGANAASVLLGNGGACADGPRTVEAQYRDAAGNVLARSDDIVLDTTDPETTDDAPAGWRDHAITVTLTASDSGGSGVDAVWYSLDSGPPTEYSETTGVPIATEGEHSLEYWSVDRAGNEELPHESATVRVDLTDPHTSQSGADDAWHCEDVTIDFLGSDIGGSGLADTEYKVDGGVWTSGLEITLPATPDGGNDDDHVVLYRSRDNAGRVEAEHSCHVKIDTTPPETTDDAPAGWVTHAVTVTLTPSDAGSGVLQTQYRLDGGGWRRGTSVLGAAPPGGSNDGIHTIDYRSVDSLVNIEDTHTCQVRIDCQKPLIDDNADDLWHQQFLLVLDSSDSEGGGGGGGCSGIDCVEYRVNGGEWRPLEEGDNDVLFRTWKRGANTGIHTVDYRATDKAGNTSDMATCNVKLDGKAPRTICDAPLDPVPGPVRVTFTAVDPDSGVAETWYSLDGAEWCEGDWVDITDEGAHWVDFYSIDGAGNRETRNHLTPVLIERP